MNIFKIDTSDNLSTTVELVMDNKPYMLVEKRKSPGDQNVLELIEKILKQKQIKLEDIHDIQVNTGPGSFTGLRVGAAIANALSFGTSIPVNGNLLGKIVIPEY